MRTIKNSLLTSLLMLLPACLFFTSDIREINSIQEVITIFEQAAPNDLFVFDIDNVLLETGETPFQARFDNNTELKKIFDDFDTFRKAKKDPEEHGKLFFSKISLKDKLQPIENVLIDNILSIQKRNIRVIALTAFNTGKCGLIDRLEELRYKQLLNHRLDFSRSFTWQDIKFDELHKTEHAAKYKAKEGREPSPAVFYKGIVCTSVYPKGIVLRSLIEKFGWRPTQIYFFDDKRKNVDSVVQEMKKMGIKCQAFVYKAASLNQALGSLDIEVARFQYELMKQRDDDDYVSYSEAKAIFDKQKRLNKKHAQPIQAMP